MDDVEPIHVYIPGSAEDPRRAADVPSDVVAHHGPPLHPDDLAIVDGIPVTSVARTLIDLAEVMDEDELRACFAAARDKGLLDLGELEAARARVEWRPSLAMFDAVMADFRSSPRELPRAQSLKSRSASTSATSICAFWSWPA